MATNVKRQSPPKPGHGPGYFFHAANERALSYANEALDLARKDTTELQNMTVACFNQIVDARGDYGKRMFTSIDAHARTPEFGEILWNNARIGRAVLELVEREIEAREARRPDRRAWAFVVGVLTEFGILSPKLSAATVPNHRYPDPMNCELGRGNLRLVDGNAADAYKAEAVSDRRSA